MMDVTKTQLIECKGRSKDIGKILENIYLALNEQGYKPVSQIVGYILSGDPTYITKHKGARNSISNTEQDDLITFLLNYFFNNIFK